MNYNFVDPTQIDNTSAVIKVIGVGGGGGNAVKNMLVSDIEGVDFICANTDAQALRSLPTNNLIQLGSGVTKGLGAGADPDIGRQAALEDRDRIADVLDGADMVFIAAGMGGGTGTGAAPVVAQISKELGILTVAVVTLPFALERKKRANIADQGVRNLSDSVDSLIVIPNDKILQIDRNIFLKDAFKMVDNVLLGAVKGIAELITVPGMINVDFADVRAVMSKKGGAMMGTGMATGEDRAKEATTQAISSPLLEDINLSNAKGVLVNVTAGKDMSVADYEEVGNVIDGLASDDADVVIGNAIDESISCEMRVTVVATGLYGHSPDSKKSDRDPVVKLPNKYEKPKLIDSSYNINRVAKNDSIDAALFDVPTFLRHQAD